MNDLLNKHFAFLLVLFIAPMEIPILFASTESPPPENFVIPHTVHVNIYNNLGDGLSLTVHCKSKDDDLGIHVLQDGQLYGWKFRVNIVASTLFFCGFTWRDGGGVYDIYVADRDLDRCPRQCDWRILKNGVHGYGKTYGESGEDLYFRWK